MPKALDGRTIFWWAQPAPTYVLRRGRVHEPAKIDDTTHMLRDGGAFSFIHAALALKYRGIIFNFDPNTYGLGSARPPILTSRDMLVSVTRPALDDDPENNERPLARSQSELEIEIFGALRRNFFDYANRDAIVLTDRVGLSADAVQYRGVRFAQRKGAQAIGAGNVNYVNEIPNKKTTIAGNHTIAYTCWVPRVSDSIPSSLLLTFGLNGSATQNWTYLLYSEHRNLLSDLTKSSAPRLVISRIQAGTSGRIPTTQQDLQLSACIVADALITS